MNRSPLAMIITTEGVSLFWICMYLRGVQEREESVGVPSDSKGGSQQGFESAGTGSGGAGGVRKRHGTATRIVTVAGLACPCGGTHIKSTGQLEGVRVTKVKAKKGTLRVSYTLASPRS